MGQEVVCEHCFDTVADERLIVKNDSGNIFCCMGCKAVFEILKFNNLEDYYNLRQGQKLPQPSDIESDYKYLDSEDVKNEFLDATKQFYTFKFFIEGIHCVACLWLLEKIPEFCSHVITSRLSMSSSILELKINKNYEISKVAILIKSLGYKPHAILSTSSEREYKIKEDRTDLIRIGVAFACAGNIMLYSLAVYAGADNFFKYYFNMFSFLCAIPSLTYCAWPFYKSAFFSLKTSVLSIDIPIVVALNIGLALGLYSFLNDNDFYFFDTLSVLVFLLLSSRYILKKIQYSFLGAENLSSFISRKTVKKIDSARGTIDEVLSGHIKIGDKIVVEINDEVPLDGIIIDGASYINNSLLTGEVKPEKVICGNKVYMGAKNLNNKFTMEVTEKLEDTRLNQIYKEVEKGWSSSSRYSYISHKLSQFFVLFITIISAATFIYFSIFTNMEIAIIRTLSLLIITCPCALALSTPLALILSLSILAKRGMLVKNEFVLEKLAFAKNIYFDKTGTLTYGEFFVKEIVLDKFSKEESQKLYEIIYNLELHSSHPIAKSLVSYLEGKMNNIKRLENLLEVKEIAGRGVEGTLNGEYYEIKQSIISQDTDSDECVSFVSLFKNGETLLSFKLADKLREDTSSVIKSLSDIGLTSFLLSGDNKKSVSDIADQAGFTRNKAYYSKGPEDKSKIIQERANSVMIGDGVNDAIALQKADVGIAVSGSAEVSLRAADVYMPRGGASKILELIIVSKQVLTIIKNNILISATYNVFGIYLAVTGNVTPLVAAVLMPLSSLSVFIATLLSTKRLKKLIT